MFVLSSIEKNGFFSLALKSMFFGTTTSFKLTPKLKIVPERSRISRTEIFNLLKMNAYARLLLIIFSLHKKFASCSRKKAYKHMQPFLYRFL